MPSSREIARLVETHISSSSGWIPLEKAIYTALEAAFPKMSELIRSDLSEANFESVEEMLRERYAVLREDGGIPIFELDSKEAYIRRINERHTALAAKLRVLEPFYFEVVCKKILDKLGGKAENTQKSYDGGVDFFALDLPPLSSNFPLPKTAYLTVIGQAKCYIENNEISETEVRKFIGGAMLRQEELRKENKIRVLSPVYYAFWTTSDLQVNARKYSQKMGIWHLDGLALAEYILKLGLEDEVFNENTKTKKILI